MDLVVSFIKSTRSAARTLPPLPPECLRRSLPSLHPDEQSVEERAALLLGDPLDLGVAEARVEGLAVAERLGSHFVGAGTHAHLESHLSLVAAVRTGVLKSAGREETVSECSFSSSHVHSSLKTVR